MKEITFNQLVELLNELLPKKEVSMRSESNTGQLVSSGIYQYKIGNDYPYLIRLITTVGNCDIFDEEVESITIEHNCITIKRRIGIQISTKFFYFNEEKSTEIELESIL